MESIRLIEEEIRRIELVWRDSAGLTYRKKHLLPLEQQLVEMRRTMDNFRRQKPSPPSG